jgi:transcription elongation factor Elf1
MAVPIIGQKCHYCSKFFPFSQVIHFGESMVRCFQCQEKHLAALEVLAGNAPKACGECGLTFAVLAARQQGEQVSMFMHWKDGMYQLLCAACDRKYVEGRKDLYGPTRFGWERKLS